MFISSINFLYANLTKTIIKKTTQQLLCSHINLQELEKAISLKDKARQREMKEQKDRYKHAKEELQRVQEDFRSLRERLQVTLQQLRFSTVIFYMNVYTVTSWMVKMI